MQSEVRRGWRLILASGLGIICSSVVLPYYSIGALVGPLTAEFDWLRSDVQFAILFSSGLGVLTAPIVGMLSDRYGPRALVLPCLVGLALGFFIAALSNGHLWIFYTAYAVMAILGAGTTPITWTRAIASAFDRQRGMALGITLTGTGICAMLSPIYAVWLVGEFGWRGAYVGLGLLPLLLAGPVVFTWFRPPRVAERELGAPAPAASNVWGLSLAEAFRSYKFWVLCVSIFAVYLAMSGITPNLIPAMTDQGLTPAIAARIQGLLGVAIILGRLVVGVLVDRFWAPGVALVSLLLPVIGCLVLAAGPTSLPLIYVSVLLIGFAAGAELDLMAFLVSRYFGLRHYSTIYSIMYALLAFGSGTAPYLFAAVYDRTASYEASFVGAAVLFAIGAVVVVFLGRYPVQGAAGASTHESPDARPLAPQPKQQRAGSKLSA